MISAQLSGVESGNSLEASAATIPAGNAGFEFPDIPSYQYNPPGALWAFAAQSGSNGSGISANGSGFTSTNSAAPEGNQVAFLQGTGSFSKSFTTIPGFTYVVTFSAAQRNYGNPPGQTWDLRKDGATFASFAPLQSATAYTDYTGTFIATSTSHVISFVGTNTRGGDNTIFIDHVRLSGSETPATPPQLSAVPGDTVVHLSWPPVVGAYAYRIKRSTSSSGPFNTTVVTATPGTFYTDTGLTNGTTYHYTATALITSGEGPVSTSIPATPAASGSLVPRATNAGGVSSSSNESVNPNENIAKLFDGSNATKWFQNVSSSDVWIQYQFASDRAWTITRYSLTSGNDVPDRDPASWRFEASNSGTTWTTLDTRLNQTFSSRGLTRNFDFTSATPYRYYRIFITANLTPGAGIQLAEFGLLSSAADPGDKTAPTLGLPANITVPATSNDTATVSFSPTANDAVYGSVSVVSTPDSNTSFSLGTTSVQSSATDLAGNTATGSFSVTVNPAYQAPGGLSATALSESQIRLNWTDNATGEAGYQLESSPAGAGIWTMQSAPLPDNSTQAIAAGLNASTAYDFRVKATGPAGSSPYASLTTTTPGGVGDGIPGAWRYQYFGNGLSSSGNAAADADPDGDGMTNAQEYAAGTDPTNSGSVLKISQLTPGGGGWLVSFPTVVGKFYRLQRSGTLQLDSWSTVQDQIAGTGSVIQITDSSSVSETERFYRLLLLP